MAVNKEKKVIDINNLSVTYFNENQEIYAVRDVSLSVNKGDSLGIVGESGSGKSTLAMAILRLLSEKNSKIEGEAIFGGKNILEISPEEMKKLRWKEISVVFQKSMNSLSPVHRISTQVEDIYRAHVPSASDEEIRSLFLDLLKLVNLPERVYTVYPHELSGGMLQRVSIALSLIHNPLLLILDEATTALDVVTQGQILDEIKTMEEERDMTRIMITHDISVVSASCNKIAVMYAGKLLETGNTVDVLKNPKHPYTKGLLSSFPALRGEKNTIRGLKGYLPDLSIQHKSCVFAPRCSNVMDKCRIEEPKQVRLEDCRVVSCFLYDGGVNGE